MSMHNLEKVWLLMANLLRRRFPILVLGMLLANGLGVSAAQAQKTQWIWLPGSRPSPSQASHFRRVIRLIKPQRVLMTIAADDAYELYINGRRVAAGPKDENVDKFDLSKYVREGKNLVAIKVVNQEGKTAGLAAEIKINENNRWRQVPTDRSWKVSGRPLPLWTSPLYNDSGWVASREIGVFNNPSDSEATAKSAKSSSGQTAGASKSSQPTKDASESTASDVARFRISEEFEVSEIASGDLTGSLIAMAFDEFGHLIVSREGGPLMLVYDSNNDGQQDKMRTYCEKIKNCQGILPLNGDVFAIADGPDGAALYQLSDKDQDGKLEDVKTLLKFRGALGEHGPHGLTLGPDGLIYIVVGNHSAPAKEYAASSPFGNYYEGDLLTPRYEDPGGHAVGVKAPGGVIIRTNTSGDTVELVAGGLRNPYDLAFNADGELFTYDSDMESDQGAAWYRPTRMLHVTPGAEFGWRSGWSKWPSYFIDSLPAAADTGRGSPTGVALYDHFAFPARYHKSMFVADWSEGRILSMKLTADGASYKAKAEPFLTGQPLNVTDLAVGPEGALYFITGGRGTEGGIYRVSWRGEVPDKVSNLGDGIEAVIRQPQLQSAWARQAIATAREEVGDDWRPLITEQALDQENSSERRLQALNVLRLFGPSPEADDLDALAADENPEIRMQAAWLTVATEDDGRRARLLTLLGDENARVRRCACESLFKLSETVGFETLRPMLLSSDRFESWSARKLLEQGDGEQWRDVVLKTKQARLFVQGALALLTTQPDKQTAQAILVRVQAMLDDFVSDRDFVDIMRITQLALIRGEFKAEDAPDVRAVLEWEYPSSNPTMNRELVRLLTFLKSENLAEKFIEQLESDIPLVEKTHLAFHLRFMAESFTGEEKFKILQFYEDAQKFEGGASYDRYLQNCANDFARSLTPKEARKALAQGDQMPSAALGALYLTPHTLDAELLDIFEELNGKILDEKSFAYRQLKSGIAAVLARSGDEESMALLRDIWETDPERRVVVAMGLAQKPDGDNWDYLLRSAPILEGPAAREVLRKLQTVNYGPADPTHYRQIILCGLRLERHGAQDAVALLEHWTGESRSATGDNWKTAIEKWQAWFAEQYPDRPAAELPVAGEESKWSFDELLEWISDTEADEPPSKIRGELVFTKGNCAKCHRFGGVGEAVGPDLTSVSKRFMQKEILQALVYPSHVISDQYAAKTVVTKNGRTFTGLVGKGAKGELTIVTPDGKRLTIKEADVEEIEPSKKSAMPDGLLDQLEKQEIVDLFEYLSNAPKKRLVIKPLTSGTR